VRYRTDGTIFFCALGNGARSDVLFLRRASAPSPAPKKLDGLTLATRRWKGRHLPDAVLPLFLPQVHLRPGLAVVNISLVDIAHVRGTRQVRDCSCCLVCMPPRDQGRQCLPMAHRRVDHIVQLSPLAVLAQFGDRIGSDLIAIGLGQFELASLEAHPHQRKGDGVSQQLALGVRGHHEIVNKTGTKSRIGCSRRLPVTLNSRLYSISHCI
jgi:hypothetical protein